MDQGNQLVKSVQDFLNTKAMDALEERLVKFGKWAVEYSINNRDYQSFTGNTVTSITAGIYRNGKLSQVISSSKMMPSPVRVKVTDGNSVYLENPYEGRPRFVRGKKGLGVKPEFGIETAMKELHKYRPPSNVPVAMVLCAGTEYASYLEREYELCVLQQTLVDADSVAIQIIKQSIC